MMEYELKNARDVADEIFKQRDAYLKRRRRIIRNTVTAVLTSVIAVTAVVGTFFIAAGLSESPGVPPVDTVTDTEETVWTTESVAEEPTTEEGTAESTETETETEKEVPTETETESETEVPTETEMPTEATTESWTDPRTEAPTEAPTEAATEAATEMPTEAPTEQYTDPTTAETTEGLVNAPTTGGNVLHGDSSAGSVGGYVEQKMTEINTNNKYYYDKNDLVFVDENTYFPEIVYKLKSERLPKNYDDPVEARYGGLFGEYIRSVEGDSYDFTQHGSTLYFSKDPYIMSETTYYENEIASVDRRIKCMGDKIGFTHNISAIDGFADMEKSDVLKWLNSNRYYLKAIELLDFTEPKIQVEHHVYESGAYFYGISVYEGSLGLETAGDTLSKGIISIGVMFDEDCDIEKKRSYAGIGIFLPTNVCVDETYERLSFDEALETVFARYDLGENEESYRARVKCIVSYDIEYSYRMVGADPYYIFLIEDIDENGETVYYKLGDVSMYITDDTAK